MARSPPLPKPRNVLPCGQRFVTFSAGRYVAGPVTERLLELFWVEHAEYADEGVF